MQQILKGNQVFGNATLIRPSGNNVLRQCTEDATDVHDYK